MSAQVSATTTSSGPQNATEVATDSELSPAQHAVLRLMLEGHSIPKAAELAGRDKSTVYKWLREDAAFLAAWRSALATDLDVSLTTMTNMRASALARLARLLDDDETPHAVVVRICELILDRTGLGAKPTKVSSDGDEERPLTSDEAREAEEIARRLRDTVAT